MKQVHILFLVLIFITQGQSQSINFELAQPQPAINEVYIGHLIAADLDSDGDNDLIQSGIGENSSGQSARVTVFLNDGSGSFSETSQAFIHPGGNEYLVHTDIDNDGDIDLIIQGVTRADYYRNDGNANFSIAEDSPFLRSDNGQLIAGDIDLDGDTDVIQFGQRSQNPPFSNIYLNDGSGSFTLDESNDFESLYKAQIQFFDLENDGDLDLLTFGENESDESVVFVYENNGQGVFTTFVAHNILDQEPNGLSIGDIDNDGDQDLLISGMNPSFEAKTHLYINNGSGQFAVLENTPFLNLFAGSNVLTDFDNDNDLDVLLVGSEDGGVPNIFSVVYENLGANNFVVSDTLGGEYIATICAADLNGDNLIDIAIQGVIDDTSVYWNETISTKINETQNENITVYPNPTRGTFQVDWSESSYNLIQLIDINGKIVHSERIVNQYSYHGNRKLAAGLYIIKMYSANGVLNKKILVID